MVIGCTPLNGSRRANDDAERDTAHSNMVPAGSGTADAPSELVNLFIFQRPKSDPSTSPSALKSPAVQAATELNLFVFQKPKSEPSTPPFRSASPSM